jgi:serine/threonine protein kinase/tetratricopeptide (TPR) repeat protein
MKEAPGDLSGTKIDGYLVERLVGRGGMGEVYLARREADGKQVALKIMAPDLEEDPERHWRFLREFRAARQLSHPNLVKVYEAGVYENRDYFTMEYVEGEPLQDVLNPKWVHLTRQGRLHPERMRRLLAVARQLASALSHLHSRRIIHRDLKPSNIQIERGNRVRLLDLGLVRTWWPEVSLSVDRHAVGSLSYMAPEQLAGERSLDPRCDLYALGVILFEFLTGRPPIQGRSRAESIARKLRDEPTQIERLNPLVPRRLARLVHRLIARDADDRFALAEEVQAELRDLEESFPDLEGEVEASFSGPAEPIQVRNTKFTAREQELERLIGALDSALSGELQVGIIRGPYGIGKTRLLDELTRWHVGPELGILRPRTEAQGSGTREPRLLAELVKGLLRLAPPQSLELEAERLEPYSAVLRMLAPDLWRPRESREGDPLRQSSPMPVFAVAALLQSVARHRPLLIVIDDLHELDEDELKVLPALLRVLRASKQEAPRLRVCLLGTIESGASAERELMTDLSSLLAAEAVWILDLEPLSRGAIQELIMRTLGVERFPRELLQGIIDVSSGNPLVMRELVAMLCDAGVLVRRDRVCTFGSSEEQWLREPALVVDELSKLPLPARLREMIARPFRRLDEGDVVLLQRLSVFGDRIDDRTALLLAGGDVAEVSSRLQRLLRAGVLVPAEDASGAYGFASPLHRLWLLASMSPEERAAQHQAILRLCGRARTLDHRLLLRLAYNAFAAEAPLQGAILAHRHARVLEREGRTVAARRYERLARRALDRVREEGELDEGTQQVRLRILENLGLLQQRRLDLAAAMESFSQLYRAARALGAPLMAARALRRMGEITERQGQLRDAEPFHRRAHRIARTGGAREEQAASLTSLGLCYTHLGRFEDGRHCFRLALGIWRKLPPSPGRLATIRNLARVHLKLGDLDKARKAYAEIGRLLRDLDDVRERAELQLDLGKFHEISHHYASALEAYQLGVDLARDANQLELWILGMMRLAELHAAARRFDEAFFWVERMLATARSMEDPGHFARALFELGEINALCEDRGTARACYTRVKRLATLHQDALLKIRADLRLAELRSVTAPKEGARMRLMAHEEAETTGSFSLLLEARRTHARILEKAGDFDRAWDVHRQVLDMHQRHLGHEDLQLLWDAAKIGLLTSDSPQAECLQRQVRRAVQEILQELSPEDQEWFSATYPAREVLPSAVRR